MNFEPRCSLTNVGTRKFLAKASSGWSAVLTSEPKNHKLKLQWCERGNGNVVLTTLIRTDNMPEALLDGSSDPITFEEPLLDVAYSKFLAKTRSGWSAVLTSEPTNHNLKWQWCLRGNINVMLTTLIQTDNMPEALLDGSSDPITFEGKLIDTKKRFVESRWWHVTYLDPVDNVLVVAFRNKVSGEYLADIDGDVGTIDLPVSVEPGSIPKKAQWEIRICGKALSKKQKTAIAIGAPAAALVGAAGGVVAFVAAPIVIAGAATAVGVTSVAAAVTAAPVGAAAAVTGAAVGGVGGATPIVLKSMGAVGQGCFVDW